MRYSTPYNPYRKYSTYWWRYWLNVPSDVKEFLQRVWAYRELLWNDNDYDYASVLHFVRFKLKRLREHLEAHAITAHAEDNIAELAKCDVLLRNVIDEDPDNEWSRHSDQWHHYERDDWSLNTCGAKKECAKAAKAGMKREQQNWRKLWRHLDRYMQGWWD